MTDLLERAAACEAAGFPDKALVLYQQALEAECGNLEALKGVGRTLLALRRLDASAETWEAARAVAPDDPEALFQCGHVCFRRGDMAGARVLFRAALAVNPDLYGARGMDLLSLLYSETAAHDAVWTVQREWGAQRPPGVVPPFANDPDPDRPLRVGFLSSDFRAHSVGFNLLPLYSRIDRDAFQLYSYAEVAHPDAATGMFEGSSDRWLSTVGMSDYEIAAAIRVDRIDILVVLAGHVDENRPFVARLRPAPVQVSHHDICSSAIPEIDYFIGDGFVTPRGGPERFSERVVRLPNFTVHTIPAEARAPGPLPAARAGHITFGSYNAPQKLSDACLDVWGELLYAVPGSRLVLKYFEAYSETATRARVLDRLAARGVSSDRITLLEKTDKRPGHLAAYDTIDIALDPFPFNGATTTFEALLMGVPVVSLVGERFVSRCAAATLDAVGMTACMARDVADYKARAIELASNLERLAAIRAALPKMVTSARICNANRYVRHISRLYRALWRRWCAQVGK